MNKSLLRNSLWLLSIQAVVKAISFAYLIIIARNLEVSNFGIYITALSYFTLVSSVADLGISRVVTREIAKNSERSSELLIHAVVLRSMVLLLFVALFCLGIMYLDSDEHRSRLSIFALLAVLPQGISFTLDAVFIALSKASYSARASLVLSLGSVIAGVVLLNMGYGVYGIVTALMLGQLLHLAVLIYFAYSQNIHWDGKFSKFKALAMLREAVPYGILGLLGMLFFKIDTLLLVYIRGNYEAGIYGAAYKFLEAIVFIPSTIAVVLFPLIAKLHEQNVAEIQRLYPQLVRSMAFIGIVFSLGFLLLLPMVIYSLLPSYIMAVEVVKVLALAIPFMFIHVPLAQIVLSSGKYIRPVIILSIFTLIVNIALNLVFIPIYGFMAAAWVTVVSDIMSFIVLFVFISRKIG